MSWLRRSDEPDEQSADTASEPEQEPDVREEWAGDLPPVDEGSAAAVSSQLDVQLDPDTFERATRRAVSRALAEDLGVDGDVTSRASVPASARGVARVVARQRGIVAGLDTLVETCAQVDGRLVVELAAEDGDEVSAGAVIAHVEGPLRSMLTAERTALNLLGHLSGVATETRIYVEEVADTGCEVRDTRKTLPGLRFLEKAAVRAGGGTNHRLGLYDALLVKDNHIVAAGGVYAATRAALDGADGRPVQVEVTTRLELEHALDAGATELLVDNVTPQEAARAVRIVAGRAFVEVSGGITIDTVRAYAEAGVDAVSLGALTHSARRLDVALDVARSSVTRPGAEGPGGARSLKELLGDGATGELEVLATDGGTVAPDEAEEHTSEDDGSTEAESSTKGEDAGDELRDAAMDVLRELDQGSQPSGAADEPRT